MPEFVRARHAGLRVETVLPVTSLPYLAGWEQVVEPPAADEAAAAATHPDPSGTTPVGRPSSLSQES